MKPQFLVSTVLSGGSFALSDVDWDLQLESDTGTYQDAGKATPADEDNDVVWTWEDQSGNSNDVVQATGANQPHLKLNIVNSEPIVRFDGAADFLQKTVGLMKTNFTLFYVWAATDDNTAGGVFESVDADGVSNRITVFGDTRTDPKNHANYAPDGTGRTISNDSDLVDDTFYIGLLRANGTTVQGWRNGVSQGTVSQGASTINLDTITVGRQSIGPVYLKGDLAAILEIETYLGTNDINNTGQLLADRYNLSWTNINP